MIAIAVQVPYASFRKSYARSFAETYALPPPATVYGMLLSLVGERYRVRHVGVGLALAFKCQLEDENGTVDTRTSETCGRTCLPLVATNVRKLSRFKYGVVTKDKIASGHKLDFVETLSGIDFLCWIDSSLEKRGSGSLSTSDSRTLEERVAEAIREPDKVDRYGVLSLGLSDDAVNSVSLCDRFEGDWHRLLPSDIGSIELPIWVDHVGAAYTRWQRFELEEKASPITKSPGTSEWAWTEINDPRPS